MYHKFCRVCGEELPFCKHYHDGTHMLGTICDQCGDNCYCGGHELLELIANSTWPIERQVSE